MKHDKQNSHAKSLAAGGGEAPLVAISGVVKSFRSDFRKRKQLVIDNLSCAFRAGRCSGLLGHNGAGKTTTIRLILGLIRPDSGTVLFAGRPLTTADKRHLGYMPEVNKLPAGLSPVEILRHQVQLFATEGLTTRSEQEAAVEAKLHEVGLSDHRKKLIGHLSKGMARRLAWAQATIHKPRFLILDEPASGLDPLGRRRMLSWIEAEKARGTSILLCTHELAQVAGLCDDLFVLRRGRLVLSRCRGEAGWRQSYALHVSGIDAAGLERLAAQGKLPAWNLVRQEGFLAALSFEDYEHASQWLAALLAKGYVVTRFVDETSISEAEIDQYFEGDP